ncbi:sensor histidine kinase [Nocardioides aquiterrae]|uniref:sensor histidine kinase n=1 Tax=Nocardioides aquiterrae TaxID=203799 RepID=UPI0031D2F983
MATDAARAGDPTPGPGPGTRMVPLDRQWRHFRAVLRIVVLACVVCAVLLQPFVLPADTREVVTSVATVVSGAFLAVSSWLRARHTIGRRRRFWRLVMLAVLLAMLGNGWTAAVGADPVASPSRVGDLSITLALVVAIAAVLGYPSIRRRGIDHVVVFLDGFLVGGAILVISSTLVYAPLLDLTRGSSLTSTVSTMLNPVLDVTVLVVVILALLRSRGADRRALLLLALGFSCWIPSDLAYAVLVAKGDFRFGTPLDLGWIVGYALVALAAWYPSVETDTPEDSGKPTQVPDTALVYTALISAAAVQVLSGAVDLNAASRALWLALAVAVAGRQILLTRDNVALRRSLEQRVQEQTEDLRRLARQTEVLLTSVDDGIYGVDASGDLTFVNPSGARALGYAGPDLLGRNAHDVFHVASEDGGSYPYSGCYIAEAIDTGTVTSAQDDVYIRADGSTFPVEISASPLVDERPDARTVRGAVVVFRDVTQRREVERMKNEFLSVVSHELRTPLTSIRGSLDLVVSGVLGELAPRARSLLSTAADSTERLTRLINDILDLERIESGTRTMELTTIEAGELLTRSATEMAGLARSTGVRVEVRPSPGRVVADPDRIVQTLTNLVNNAIKFSSEGQTVVLDTRLEDGHVLFRVRDQGRGIPEDRLQSVFERFEQVDSSDSRQKGGTGLGLAISRGIVERHGGQIWMESTLGEGTTVFFTLPRPGHARQPRTRPAALAGTERSRS